VPLQAEQVAALVTGVADSLLAGAASLEDPAVEEARVVLGLAPEGSKVRARLSSRVGQIQCMWQAQATVFPVELTAHTARELYKYSKNTDLANPTQQCSALRGECAEGGRDGGGG